MTKQRLGKLLRWQWWLHTTIIGVFYTILTFFFLFVIEDSLYEQQLGHIAQIIAQNDNIENLPAHIQLQEIAQLPLNWQQQLATQQNNRAVEVENSQGAQVHLLKFQPNHRTTKMAITLDTSKTQSVWAMSHQLLLLLLPWLLLFLAIATFAANRFAGHIQRHFEQLLHIVKQSDCPEPLQAYATHQNIDELAQFATLFAQTWQQKLDLLTREKQSLEFLSHELRTPLQSSMATLELLALKISDKQHITRLSRSLNRMHRLSNSILCLMSTEQTTPAYSMDIFPICQQLIDELQPLAKARGQTIELSKPNKGHTKTSNIVASKEMIETIVSILLTNAMTHGCQGQLLVTIERQQLSIFNTAIKPSSEYKNDSQQSFGIGLTIAQRLADKFALKVSLSRHKDNEYCAKLSWNIK